MFGLVKILRKIRLPQLHPWIAQLLRPFAPHVIMGALCRQLFVWHFIVVAENGFAELDLLGSVPTGRMRKEPMPEKNVARLTAALYAAIIVKL